MCLPMCAKFVGTHSLVIAICLSNMYTELWKGNGSTLTHQLNCLSHWERHLRNRPPTERRV